MQQYSPGGACALLACVASVLVGIPPASAQAQTELQREAVLRLAADTEGRAEVGFADASGGVGQIRFNGGIDASGRAEGDVAETLVRQYGGLFGADDPANEFVLAEIREDDRGWSRYEFEQQFDGTPVFGAGITVHFDANGEPRVMSGLALSTLDSTRVASPLPADEASLLAIESAPLLLGYTPIEPLTVQGTPELYRYRVGIDRGAHEGPAYLAWRIVLHNGLGVRRILWVDARSGRVIDDWPGVIEAVSRTVYDHRIGGYDAAAPDENVLRTEGDPLVGDDNADPIFEISGVSHDLYEAAFGYESWDGAGAPMFAEAYWTSPSTSCPNAVWNGTTTAFCNDVVSVDVIAHEWQHAYTQTTAGLIYAYEPGALNEGYSDIFGEVVDFIAAGCESPDYVCDPFTRRAPDECSFDPADAWPVLTVSEPGDIAGEYAAAPGAFGPSVAEAGPVTGRLVLVSDGRGAADDACSEIDNSAELAGNIAVAVRGGCTFKSKARRAEAAGATALVVIDNVDGPLFLMGDATGGQPGIPTVLVSQADGATIRAQLAAGVVGTIDLPELLESERWLVGDRDNPLGVIRDMWEPNCLGAPGTVGDEFYWCRAEDNGGVHINSQISTRLFSLLSDGHGITSGIGVLKATHIHWLALTEYMGPTTGFREYADALVAACDELEGAFFDLPHLETGLPSGHRVGSTDCNALDAAIAAVGLRDDVPCDYVVVLEPRAPPACAADGGSFDTVFFDDFETDPAGRWIFTNFGVEPEYRETDWEWVTGLPGGRAGAAAFALDSVEVGDCGDDDQSGVVELTSPDIVLPDTAGALLLTFTHYVATESLWDGGNLRVSVDGGEFVLVPGDAFRFNTYNEVLNVGSNPNPLAGEPAFTGFDQRTVSGSWGESQVDLSGLAEPGATVRIQFRFGVDGCNGLDGWYVDDVAVGHCSACSSTTDCDDGNDCTTDSCDAATGACINERLDVGAACGDSTDTPCNGADTCDAAGVCQPNIEGVGTLCGDPATGCSGPDICDGAGSCLPNHTRAGRACGDRTATACSAPDLCDGAGTCLANHAEPGTLCGDPATECSGPDICDGAGSCLPNHTRAGRACGDRTATACSAPDLCDGAGTCLANHAEPGTACGDPSHTECSAPDACDGAGACLENHVPAGDACGDPTTGACDGPDVCDGAGTCDPALLSDGTVCDFGDACVALATCRSGTCDESFAVDCGDEDPCTEDLCDPVDGCYHVRLDTPECAESEDVGPDAGDVGLDAGDVGPDTGDVGPDAEPDVGPDAEPDVGPDAEPDVGPDAEPDVAPDAEPDAEPDVGPDAEPDVGPDAEPDVAPDAEPDAEPDVGPDAEPDVGSPGDDLETGLSDVGSFADGGGDSSVSVLDTPQLPGVSSGCGGCSSTRSGSPTPSLLIAAALLLLGRRRSFRRG